jgi:hypothetical protein
MRMIRPVLASLLPLAALACSGASSDAEDIGVTSSALSPSQIADDALNDMLTHAVINPGPHELHGFWDTNRSTFQNGQTAYGAELYNTGYWTNAQVLDAVLDGVERNHGTAFAYWIPRIVAVCETQFGGWFEKSYDATWFDDITWMTLALIHAYDVAEKYHLPNASKYLDDARYVFDGVIKYAPSYASGHFDGLWWNMRPNLKPDVTPDFVSGHSITHDNDEKATASNFTAVIASARLAERTSDARTKKFYEEFASAVYDYWFHYAHTDEDGRISYVVERQSDGSLFVADGINNGKLQTAHFTYNQGAGIGAALEMANIDTKNSATHIAEAHGMADYLVAHETIQVNVVGKVYGGLKQLVPWQILIDGTDSAPAPGTGSATGFKGVAFRYLAEMYNHDFNNPSHRTTTYAAYLGNMIGSVQGILFLAHDSAKREIGFRWDLPITTQESVSADTAALQAEHYNPAAGTTLAEIAKQVAVDNDNLGCNASGVMAIQLLAEAQ